MIKGDKGIDGIYINEAEGTIDVFQTKLTEKKERTLGDTSLKEFYGSLQQLKTEETITDLLNSGANEQLKGLIIRTNLQQLINQYDLRGIFISNMELDNNGIEYLQNIKEIKVIGPSELKSNYISNTRNVNPNREAIFSLGESEYLKYSVDSSTFAIIAPIKAIDIAKIDGIENQEVFSYNVRGHLGKTKVNKDIVKSLKDSSIHNKFPLFHNGITIVCDEIEIINENSIKISNFFVVNGCQSLSTVYDNQNSLTENLNILVKFVQVGVNSELAETITHYSNNQNGVKARDFKSNNQIQIRLKNEIESIFPNYSFEVKRGESIKSDNITIISNELAGIWMMAFDLKEPWGTHRNYQVFDEKYNDIFARPEVDAYRIIMLHIFNKIIESESTNINNKLISKYLLAKYAILFILREILEKDNLGKDLIKNLVVF